MKTHAYLILLLFLLPAFGQAKERYYMVVFAYQNPWLNVTVQAHSFVAFVKQSDLERGIAPDRIPTISWAPDETWRRRPRVRVSRVRWQPGINRNLVQTVAAYQSFRNKRTVEWGPYEITEEAYLRAMDRIRWLRSKNVSYKMLDKNTKPFGEPEGDGDRFAENCIGAMMGICDEHRRTRFDRGIAASADFVDCMRPFMIDAPPHPEVARAMRLDAILAGRPMFSQRYIASRPFAFSH